MEIANVARACGLSGFRYLCFPPRHFPARLASVSPLAELEIPVSRHATSPDAAPPPAPRFHLISELISAIETQLAPAIPAIDVSPASVARPARRIARRAARPASSLVPKR